MLLQLKPMRLRLFQPLLRHQQLREVVGRRQRAQVAVAELLAAAAAASALKAGEIGPGYAGAAKLRRRCASRNGPAARRLSKLQRS